MTPLEISAPDFRFTGSGSPVRADSSQITSVVGSPSVGVISPDRINIRIPT